jgi:LysM repeat protein
MRPRFIAALAVLTSLAAPASATAYFTHVVAPGESLSSIAAADGLTVSQLAAANGISAGAPLRAGTALQIPPQTAGAAASGAAVSPSSAAGASTGGGGSYVVQPGDTLSSIAARAGVSVASLAAANGLHPGGVLLAGTALRLAGTPGYASGSSSPASSQPVGAAAQGSVTDPPYPTPERLSASQIAQVAADAGVSPSLADAVAWQESGFNNALVSGDDARGIMQILPGTWQYIQSSLNPGTPLAPASATDNVRGGALLLRSLLSSTGGNPALAAAGYYQGLPSVLRHGMYADTQRYVHDVLALQQQFGGG